MEQFESIETRIRNRNKNKTMAYSKLQGTLWLIVHGHVDETLNEAKKGKALRPTQHAHT